MIIKAWLAFACCTVAFGGTLVLPPPAKTMAGNATGLGPSVSDASGIIQELFGSGIFSPGAIEITELSFRASPGTGGVDATFDSLNVYLSSSPSFPNGNPPDMSTTFASNVGTDQTLVFSGTNGTLSDTGCMAGPNPCPFDLNLNLTTPFVYNPANGSLLIELVFTGLTDNGGSFDAESFASPGGPVAQVVSLAGTTATSGSFAYQGSLVQLTDFPVPEPATAIMTAGGILALGLFRRSLATRQER